ncbi:hypothetical protein SEA_MARIETTA_18 [Gordonia phage Marietta]|uniref:Uncharacterized protein n=1 Tax=Gordonia phage Marietta TaxID=2301558 RepID=A0A385DR66_9CAUD|nr:hypothetical protein KNU07_gp18 [Gordonia phage Marietta]AXQ61337.1 hypothetical protein SEA_MARIETTA_18 [Gordonia phage Marietta]QAU06344.1 hypothetical protein SEA_WHOSEMANZ_18 [Gordonia phage WhoseManz]
MSERAEEVRVSDAKILASVGMARVVLSVEEMWVIHGLLEQFREQRGALGDITDKGVNLAALQGRVYNMIERMEW